MGKKRVLIVDDTHANILILNDILKGLYNISVATNGKDALKIANSTPKPDLILLDIVMPEMDGYEVTKRLKNNKLTSSIPVIYVTSKDNEEDESKGFKLGCVDYITKPVNPPTVLARVKTHIELSHAFETLEIQNKELVQAAKLRDDIEEITRHDLKNPLTGIFSAVDIMEMIGDLSDAQNEALEIMKSSANKMISMVNTSLYLYKMERNIYNLESTDINIIDIIKRIVKEFDSIFKRYKTSVSLFVNDKPVSEEDVFNIKGEMLLFYSMMANLIKNAAEANPESEPITVLLNKKDSTSFISVKNKETVPSEIHKTFFDKFATSGKKGGTGLGTYSAKMITKTLGGEISMTSSKKDGTTILISFPD
ncbi:MAG: response regulator [Desulfobacterales bacterium]|nr:response regulator [Desulfobacterales bacterium]MCP4159908.1 response regulator [Deltaproteobacteria bacterium]